MRQVLLESRWSQYLVVSVIDQRRFVSSNTMTVATYRRVIRPLLWQNTSKPRRKNLSLIPMPFFQPSGRAGTCCLFKRNSRSSLKAMLRMDCSLSKRGRCGSAWYRKLGKKQLLPFWARTISLERVGRGEEDCRGEGHRSGWRKQGNQPIGRQTQELADEGKGESKWQVKQQYLAFIQIAQV